MKNFNLIYFILIVGLSVSLLFSQENKISKSDYSIQENNSAKIIFATIEKGIAKGNVDELSRLLSPKTYFSLSNGTRGYYSSNQAYYILSDFFKMYQVITFKYQTVQAGEGNPYATGTYVYEFKGKRVSAEVYIALKNTGKIWKITQITIN